MKQKANLIIEGSYTYLQTTVLEAFKINKQGKIIRNEIKFL